MRLHCDRKKVKTLVDHKGDAEKHVPCAGNLLGDASTWQGAFAVCLTVAFCVKNRRDILVTSWLFVVFDHVLYRVRPRGDDSQDARSDDEVSDEELDMSHM